MTAFPSRPYKGVETFTAADQSIFCGRHAEVRTIVASLYAAPITILYGRTGVGKSSVLQAGVVPVLEENYGTRAVYFNRWEGEWLAALKSKCSSSLGEGYLDGSLPFDKYVKAVADITGRLIVVVLDQFEEYLDRHATHAFDGELARAVRDPDVRASFLLGIREDRFASLDRLNAKVPRLFGRTLRLGDLDRESARAAITEPLTKLESPASVDPKLVEDFLGDQTAIPAIKLQIVFDRVWEIDSGRTPVRLLAESYHTYDDPLDYFVTSRIPSWAGVDREICIRVLEDLAPDRVHRPMLTADELSPDGDRADVRRVLDALADSKILRSNVQGAYTIYHDVLERAVRRWCQKQRQAVSTLVGAEGKTDSELERSRRQLLEEFEELRKSADVAARRAEARELAACALLFADRDAKRGLDLAVKAIAVGASLPENRADSRVADLVFRYAVQNGRIQFERTARAPGRIAAVGSSGAIEVWLTDAGGGWIWRTIHVPGLVSGLLFSPEGSRLAVRTSDGHIRVWELRTDEEIPIGGEGTTPLSTSEIREVYRLARAAVQLKEPEESASRAEPSYDPFLAAEFGMEASYVDTGRE